jgi:hypothetical protein
MLLFVLQSMATHAGHVFLYADNGNSCFLNVLTGKCMLNGDGSLVSPPARPRGISSHYPFTGSAVMLPLKPNANNQVTSVDIVVFGGSDKKLHVRGACNKYGFVTGSWSSSYNLTALAGRHSHRITISWVQQEGGDGWKYSFGNGWRESDMGHPRILPGV